MNRASKQPGDSAGEKLRVQNHTWNVQLAQNINAFLARHSFRGAGALGLYAGRFLIKAPSGPTVVETAYGTSMAIDPIADNHFYGIEPSLYYTGGYERGTLEVMRAVLRTGDCYVDAGANIGTMSLWAAKLVGPTGKVYCFEPEPTIFGLLERNIALNKMQQVRPFNLALGAESGEAVIFRDPQKNRGSATLTEEGGAQPGHTVQVATLDDVLAQQQIQAVRMLKVDVEGWELDVLRGGQQLLSGPQAPILCIEYSNETNARRHEAAANIYEWVRGVNDYQVYKLRGGKQNISQLAAVNSNADLPAHDNLFCFLPAHLPGIDRSLFAKSLAKA